MAATVHTPVWYVWCERSCVDRHMTMWAWVHVRLLIYDVVGHCHTLCGGMVGLLHIGCKLQCCAYMSAW
jgi:hypothetical protein